MLIIALTVIVLILSAVFHEYAHGWMAKRLGDDTAERAGRLTLNPLKHLDWVGSVILPIMLVVFKSNFFIAWAKPVPYNPYNLRDQKFGELKVAAAGPITNLIIALVAGIIIRVIPMAYAAKSALLMGFFTNDASIFSMTQGSLAASLALLAIVVCFINIALAVFNLIPVPPLDGSKILAAILPARAREAFWRFEQYGFILLVVLLMSGILDFLGSIVFLIFSLMSGLG